MLVAGVPLDLAETYRVAVNSIVAASMGSWVNATDVQVEGPDLPFLTAHLAASSPLSPPPLDRITLLP